MVIGISGTNGSGKDTVGQMLSERYNFLFASGSDMLREEAKKRSLPIERKTLRDIGDAWRREHGLGVLVDKAHELFKSKEGKYDGLALVSIRNPGEADRIHELGGKVVWVDADPKTRYQRIYSRQRTDEDKKTFEQFLEEQQAEMQHYGDNATLNISGVKDKADIFLTNNGNDIDAFKNEAEAKLKQYL